MTRLRELGAGVASVILLCVQTGAHADARCVNFDDKAATVSYVDHSVQPLARKIISAFHAAGAGHKHRVSTREMYEESYRHVTELAIRYGARASRRHRAGLYVITADYRGSVTPKHLVAVQVTAYRGRSDRDPAAYDFLLMRSNTISGHRIGLHWNLSMQYSDSRQGYYFMISKLLSGGVVTKSLSMRRTIIDADVKQAVAVLGHARYHKPVGAFRNLAASQHLVRICP